MKLSFMEVPGRSASFPGLAVHPAAGVAEAGNKKLQVQFFRRLSVAMVAAAVAVLLILGTGAAQPAQAQVESVLHSFTGPTSDGANPDSGLIMDSKGNLYGTTNQGGSSTNCGSAGCGTVFELVYDSSTNSYTEKVLYNFTGSDGAYPVPGLIMDSAGNLFGTTEHGGSTYTSSISTGDGTVFELTPDSSLPSGYKETVLHSFAGYNSTTPASSDGAYPFATLLMGPAGNLYGTTFLGGSSTVCGGTGGCGTVFELKKTASGYSSTDNVLFNFTGANGFDPAAGLLMDSAGNLYGTTIFGGSTIGLATGALGDGTVFELKKTASGYSSTDTVLVNFTGANGYRPESRLIMDSAGNLYGTTENGGSTYTSSSSPGDGTVFELKKTASGYSSTDNVLVNFTGANGLAPVAGLIMDSSGNLYGTTVVGGSTYTSPPFPGDGTVFELKKTASGYSSTDTVLLNFNGTNGDQPGAGLITDSAGNLYGTTNDGGGSKNDGTVYGIAPVTLSASSLSFGSVGVDTTSASQTVTITNIGGGSLSYGTPLISGTNAKDFAVASNGCTAALAPAGNCSVSVTFTPSTATAETATLDLVENGLTQTISLSGTGAYATATLSPNLTFPGTLVGTESAPQPVTLTNTSNLVALTIDSISASANFTVDMSKTTCGASLAAGKFCTIDVAFSPTSTGSLTGTLTVDDNTSSGSQTVSLSGTGLTPVQYIGQMMIPQVESLGLNGGQTHSLVKELQDAAKLISEGKINGAIGNLESFIGEVNDLAGSGILTPTQASKLITETNSVIKQL